MNFFFVVVGTSWPGSVYIILSEARINPGSNVAPSVLGTEDRMLPALLH